MIQKTVGKPSKEWIPKSTASNIVSSCSEICIEADNNKDNLQVLSDLWKYTVENKYSFTLVEIYFIKEHLQNYAGELGRNDAREIKKILDLDHS